MLISAWLLWKDDDADIKKANDTRRTSDYAMTDFTMTIMDINGEPAREIKGREMAHYPVDDSTEIIKPIAEFLQPGRDSWEITAEHGYTTGKGEVILLTGNVIITDISKPAVQMLTEKLTLDTNENTAYTDQDVVIHSPNGDTHSVGLHADLDDETINLHSKVKGQYNAPAK